jgi:uncharacterized lipoprotein YddW (UPF0748 family)
MNCKPFFLIILLSFLISQYLFSADRIIRGLWIVRHDIVSPSRIDSILATAHKYHFTDLFVQVRGRGDAYYTSNYEPRATDLDESFDPLRYITEKRQGMPIKIHAWINAFYLWSSDEMPQSEYHLINLAPQWIVYPANYTGEGTFNERRGNSEGFYHSPLLPEVQEHLLQVIDDILSNYAVDGLHLDYIRYPGKDFDFHPWVRHQFMKRYILDPIALKSNKDKFIQKYGIIGYELYYDRWTKFLRDGLSDFIEKLTTVERKKHPGLIISAAVKADLMQAHWEYYQDWNKWIQKDWLDWVLPMNYTKDNKIFTSRLKDYQKLGLQNKMIIGIALYNQSPGQAMKKLSILQEYAIPSFVLFSYYQFKKNTKFRKYYLEYLLNKLEFDHDKSD